MKKKDRLLKLFRIYSSNLRFHAPELENNFVCPICFSIFPETALESKQITIEHIIPESLGGTFVTLTCRDCNNRGGTILDSNLVNRFKHEDILAGKHSAPLRAKFTVGSEDITADIYLSTTTDPNIKVVGLPELNDPKKIEQVNKALDSGTKDFKFSGNLGYIDLASRISVLKIAYLMAFSYFGYSYIKFPFLDPIRKQIMNSTEEKEIMKGIVNLAHLPFEKSCITVLKKPDNLKCFFVTLDLSTKLNRYVGVALPGFGTENTIYQHWANINYANESMKSSVIKPIQYNEEILMDEKYKNYAHLAWNIIQNSE